MPDEIDVKRVAIDYVAKKGWKAELNDCRVEPMLPRTEVRAETQIGWTTTKYPVTQWIVHITPKAPPNRFIAELFVSVELAWSTLDVVDFSGPEYPH